MKKEKIILTQDKWKEFQDAILMKFTNYQKEIQEDVKDYFNIQNLSMTFYYGLAEREKKREESQNSKSKKSKMIPTQEFLKKYPILSKNHFRRVIKYLRLPSDHWGFAMINKHNTLVIDEEKICDALLSNDHLKNKQWILLLKLLRGKKS